MGLAEVVSLGLQLALEPAAAAEGCQAIADGRIQLPSRAVLIRARAKLDVLNMYWQRRLNATSCYVRHLSIDASPQVRRNFLCTRERRVRLAGPLSQATVGEL